MVLLSWWFRIANQQSSVLWEKYNPYDRFHVGYFWTPETSTQESVGQEADEPGSMGQEPLGRVMLSLPALVFATDIPRAARVLAVFTSVFLSPGKDLTCVIGSPKHDMRRNSNDFQGFASRSSAEAVKKLCSLADGRILTQIVNSVSQASDLTKTQDIRKHNIFLISWSRSYEGEGFWFLFC